MSSSSSSSSKRDPRAVVLRVAKDHVVVFDYVLYDGDGDVVEETDEEGGEPVTCVWGYGALVPALEKALYGLAPGETCEVVVPPEDGYGAWDEAKEHWVDRADFPEGLTVEDEFDATTPDGEETTLRVVEIEGDAVLVDSNHPLAGETLRFDVIVRSVRPATNEELAQARSAAPRLRLGQAPEAPPKPAAEPPPAARPLKAQRAGVRGDRPSKGQGRDPFLDDEQ
jgi:FKBP-type peptidyl-prolyl cis-trans isomerase SlyD